MKLIINTATTLKGGGVQVAKSFIEECKSESEHEFHVILGANIGKTIDTSSFPSNFSFYKIDFRPGDRIFSLNSGMKFFDELEERISPDAVFTTSGPAYWRPKAPHLVGFNLPHYVYPDSPFFQVIPLWKKIRWKLRGFLKGIFLKKEADFYVVQTDDVNDRLRKWLDVRNVYTVSNSCNSHYFKANIYPDKLPNGHNEFRLLLLSAYHPHKNFEIIKKIVDWNLLQGNEIKFRFILTLPDDIYNKIFEEKYHFYVSNVGPVPVQECASLYKECDAMFLPTLLECFSASYVEAMYMEKPILTSDLGFARTVCQDAALYFNPLDPIEITGKINLLMSESELKHRLIALGKERKKNFKSASERAASYLDLCIEMIKQKNK